MSDDACDIMTDGSSDGEVPWEVQSAFYQDQLGQKERDLQLAADIGKQLLEDNNELSARLESTRTELTQRIEELEQEKYVHLRQLENKKHMQTNYEEELESLRSMLCNQRQDLLELLEAGHETKLKELKKQMSSMKALLDRYQLTEQQLTERNATLEEMVASIQKELDQQVYQTNETTSEELIQLSVDNNTLKQEKMGLLTEVSEYKNKCAQLELETNTIRAQLSSRDAEIEEIQCQKTSYINTLEKCREEVQELKVELDLMKMSSQDHRAKGNSLFGEVEDKRVQAEKELIAQKVQFSSLSKEHGSMKQQFHNLKLQMAGVLQMCTGKNSDVEYLSRVQSQLHKAQTNIKNLVDKLKTLEKRPFGKSPNTSLQEKFHEQQPDATNYQEYLQGILKAKEDELRKLKEEQLTMQLCLNSEENTVIELESQTHETKRQLSKLQSQNLKLHLKVEELRMKYEPEKFKTKCQSVQVKKERIPLTAKASDSNGAIRNGDLENTSGTTSPKLSYRRITVKEESSVPLYGMPQSPHREPGSPKPGTPKSAHRGINRTEPMAKRPLIMSQAQPGSAAIAMPLQTVQTRSVRISDDVQVYNLSPRLDSGGQPQTIADDGTGRSRGRHNYSNVIQAKAKVNDCKVQ